MPDRTSRSRPGGREPSTPIYAREDIADAQRLRGHVIVEGASLEGASLVVRTIVVVKRANGAYMHVTRESPVGSDGAFALEIPPAAEIVAPLTVQVRGPDGALLQELVTTLPKPGAALEIRVATPDIRRPTVKPGRIPAPAERMQGRVIDGSSGRAVAKRTLVLWVRAGEGADAVPLMAVETDARGSFFADRPPETFAAAHATVARHDGVVPLHLDGDGRLPTRLLLVLEGVRAAPKSDDCGCEAPPATIPSTQDFLASPESFAQDLGPGCVSFTRPHRSLHEKRYVFIVRTTEPQIQGLTTQTRQVPVDPGFLPRSTDIEPAARSLRLDTARKLTASNVDLTPGQLAEVVRKDMQNSVLDSLMPYLKLSDDRDRLDADNPVDWDSTPTFYQATRRFS